MKVWIIAGTLIIGVVLPVEYYIHNLQLQSIENIKSKTKKTPSTIPISNSKKDNSLKQNRNDKQNRNKETADKNTPWPSVDWKFEGRKLKLKQPTIEKGDGACQYTMNARIYNWMSDRGLRRNNIKARTPLVVLENNKPLTPYTQRSESWEKCEGKSIYHNKFVHFSPSETVTFEDQKYEIALSSELPLRTPNMVSWWLYKGYQMKTDVPKKSNYSGKEATVHIKMRMVDRKSEQPPIIRISDQEKVLERTDEYFEGSLKYTIPDVDWSISVETNIQGSYFLVERFEMTIEDQKFNLIQ